MIPLIGLMVGLYIITRCLSLILKTGEKKESSLVQIFSAVTIVVSLYVIYSMFTSGAELSQLLGR
jgi:hypothetical protein